MYKIRVTYMTTKLRFNHTIVLHVMDPDNHEYIIDCINDQLEDITLPEMKGIRCYKILSVEQLSFR